MTKDYTNNINDVELSEKDKIIYSVLTMDQEKYENWFSSLSDQQKNNVAKLLSPRLGKYVPKQLIKDTGVEPFVLSAKQQLFCLLDNKVVLAGGGGGSGKSAALITGALQYADHPKYTGLILMRNLPNLKNTIRESQEWLNGTGAEYNKVDKVWKFPEGGELIFGYLDKDDDQYQYKSNAYQYIGFDELTRFKSQSSFEYLFSRLRRPVGVSIPLRVRAATNPGDVGCFKYDNNTEVWTEFGWKGLCDITVGEKVWSVDKSGTMILKKVIAKPVFNYNNTLVSLRSRGTKMLNMTPNHRVLKHKGTRNNVGNTRNAIDHNFSLVEWQNLPGQAHLYRQAKWIGTPIASVSIPHDSDSKYKIQPDLVNGDHYCKFMGWYLSEGSATVNTRPGKKGYQISIAQSLEANPEKYKIIQTLLDNIGIKYSAGPKGFQFSGKNWYDHLSKFGKCDKKYVPDNILNATSDQIFMFLTTACLGDGCILSETERQYYSTSKLLIDHIGQCFVKCGWLVCHNERFRGTWSINGRSGTTQLSEYSLCARKPNKPYVEILTGNHVYNVKTVTKRQSDVSYESYIGKVGCLTVEDTETFFVRQEGSVWISGNSKWVYDLFINPETKDSRMVYLHMSLEENKYIDVQGYEESLSYMTGVERARMRYGDWNVTDEESMIKKAWFNVVTNRSDTNAQRVRVWDLASTKKTAKNKDPDWTASALCSYKDGYFTIDHMSRLRGTPYECEQKILSQYQTDLEFYGKGIDTYVELGGGAAKTAGDLLLRGPFSGTLIKIITTNVPKHERARHVAVAAENGHVNIMHGEWCPWLWEELSTFPNDNFHDDLVDAISHAYIKLVVDKRRSKGSFKNFGSSVLRPSGLYVPRR